MLKTKGLRTKIKEKKLVKMIIENPEQTLKESLLAVGYSESLANRPAQVTNRPSFIELMEKTGLTDNILQNKLLEGLGSNKPVVMGKELIDYPDHGTRHKYLETALKVKKHLNNEPQFNTQINDYKVIIEE